MTGVNSPVAAQEVETIGTDDVTAETQESLPSPEAIMTRRVGMAYLLDGVTTFPNALP